MSEDRSRILDLLAGGKITAEEAERVEQALGFFGGDLAPGEQVQDPAAVLTHR